MTAKCADIEKVLLTYCGLDAKSPKLDEDDAPNPSKKELGSKYRKIPADSPWLNASCDKFFSLDAADEEALADLNMSDARS